MESPTLTFTALDQRIEALPQHPSYGGSPSTRARWGNGIAMTAGLLALILGKTLPSSPALLAVVSGLFIVEVAAFVIAGTANLSGINLRPSGERREFADVLDFDLPHHLELVTWLRSFPREYVARMSSFASHRLDRFRSKLPLLTGGVDKLGVLPIAAALFIQFRDMQWPPRLGWPEVLLVGALMWMYWMSLLQVGSRIRLELYDALLKQALTN